MDTAVPQIHHMDYGNTTNSITWTGTSWFWSYPTDTSLPEGWMLSMKLIFLHPCCDQASKSFWQALKEGFS